VLGVSVVNCFLQCVLHSNRDSTFKKEAVLSCVMMKFAIACNA
jgi:hypothetical protein